MFWRHFGSIDSTAYFARVISYACKMIIKWTTGGQLQDHREPVHHRNQLGPDQAEEVPQNRDSRPQGFDRHLPGCHLFNLPCCFPGTTALQV
jgi:hypothetical protein